MELPSGLVRVASYRRKLPRKAKNIYLPTEVWVDVFCFPWISRPKMAQMVDKIGNRWFGDQLQFYLHEWGKHTLGDLRFTKQHIINNNWNQFDPLNYPQTAMPENIKFCKSLQIDHFDNRVFNFFRRIQSLLTADTKLDIRYIYERNFDEDDTANQLGNARTILGHLLPFIDGITTVRTDDRMLPMVKTSMGERFNRIKVFDFQFTGFVQSAMQVTMEWLTSSNEPKLLRLWCFEDEIAKQFFETIRKQFMKATKPSIFAVLFRTHFDFPAFQCENAIGEQLCGIRIDYLGFQVFRNQANAGDQLRQWVDANPDTDGVHNRKQCIRLSQTTIGEGPIFAMPDLYEADDNEKEDVDEKPSTSKKQRICK